MRIRQILDHSYEQFMQKELEERREYDALCIKHLNDVDLEVCDYIIRYMPLLPMNVDKINFGSVITVHDMVEIGLKELKRIDDSVSLEAKKITCSTPIEKIKTEHVVDMATAVSYEMTENGVLEDSGEVSKFVIPANLYEISGYLFGHEQLHALKDINYREYQNLKISGEVIPIFYELMIYSPEEVIKKEVLKVRISNIFDNALEYELFNDAFRANKLNEIILGEDKETIRKSLVYEYTRTKVGCYLNSFYYALILYSMYKETPQKILDLVSKVLKHEITTLEMLEQLGIYGDIRGEAFEREAKGLKKLLK